MGTILIGYGQAAYTHEGYAAQVLNDESITGTYSDETAPRMIGQVIAACGCGWAGTARYPTTTGPFDENADGWLSPSGSTPTQDPPCDISSSRYTSGSAGAFRVLPDTAPNSRPTRSGFTRALPASTCSTRH